MYEVSPREDQTSELSSPHLMQYFENAVEPSALHSSDTLKACLNIYSANRQELLSFPPLLTARAHCFDVNPLSSQLVSVMSDTPIPPPPLDGPRGGSICWCVCYYRARDRVSDCKCYLKGKPRCPCFWLGRAMRKKILRRNFPLAPPETLLEPLEERPKGS